MSYLAPVAEEHFDVRYDGPALTNHRIRVDDLASSLLALSAAIQAAHLAIDPLAPAISLDIHATNPGSFEVHLLITDNVRGAVEALSSQESTATAAGVTIVGAAYGAVKGSIRFLRWLKGKRVRSTEEIGGGQTRVTATDGTNFIVNSTVYITSQDRAFRESLQGMFRPLEREGIDTFDIGQGNDREVVTEADLDAFAVPRERDDVLMETEREAYLQLVSVSFQPGAKWRFNEGNGPFHAAMEDKLFAERIERNDVAFAKSDILRALVRTVQSRNGLQLRTDHTVVKVLDVIKGSTQVELPFDEVD